MTANHDETPTADELDDAYGDEAARRRDGRYTWLPVAGAAALAAALVLVAILLNLGNSNVDPSYGKRVDSHGALLCPKTYQQVTKKNPHVWVPAKPNQISARKQLTSKKRPTNAVACAYLAGARFAPGRLTRTTVPISGRHVLTESVAVRLNRSLGKVAAGTPSSVCSQALTATDGDDYLIGFTYKSGTLWVSTPGSRCDGATNGSFRTHTNLRSVAAAAYSGAAS